MNRENVAGLPMRAVAREPSPDGAHPAVQWEQIVGAVDRALLELPESDREILRQRFGVGGRVHDVDEVSRRFGISPDRVRQIEERALSSLRANAVRRSVLAERR